MNEDEKIMDEKTLEQWLTRSQNEVIQGPRKADWLKVDWDDVIGMT